MDNLEVEEVEISSTDTGEKLTDWKNPPSLEALKRDYTEAKVAHDTHVSDVSKWLDNLNITGKAKLKKEKNRSSLTPKLIRKQAEWRYPSLSDPFLSTDDLYNTYPRTHEDGPGAYQAGLVLNHQFNNKIRKRAFIDEYVATVVDEGTVIVRTGWDFEEEEVEVEVPVMSTVPIADPVRYQDMIDQGLAPYEDIQTGTRIEIQTKTIRNQPTVEVISYENVVIDPTCLGDVDKAKFIVYHFETSLSDLKKDKIYHNLDKINLDELPILARPDHETKDTTNFNFKDKPRKKFIAYEYWGFWDIHGTGVVKPFVCTYVGNVMIRLEENPFPDSKLPFVYVPYLPVRKSVYGQPDGELLEDNQNIIGAVTRGMIDIMGRSANGQMGIVKGALDLTNKRKFDQGLDYEFNTNVDARTAFYTHTFAAIPDSAKYMLDQQNADAESLTGKKAFHNGISGAALGDSVGGIRSALDASSKRELSILRRLADGIIEIGRKIMAMNSEFLSEEEVVRISEEEFVTIRKDDIGGQYDIKLTISTAEEDNAKAEELAFMLQTMGPNVDFGIIRLLLMKIAKLRKLPDLAKELEKYEPQPDPVAQEKAALEVELLKAQIQNEYAKAAENAVDVDYKKARTASELAKGRNINSDADAKDQKFLEKDQGLDHLHKMEELDFDRKSKLDLKAADKLLGIDPTSLTNTSKAGSSNLNTQQGN